MNRRILKKHCRRAMEILIAEYGVRPDSFSTADGEETLDAPLNMERRFVRNGFLEPGPLRGTPIFWSAPSYYEAESDCYLPTDILSDFQFWTNFKPDPKEIAEWDARAARENEAIATAIRNRSKES